MTDNIDTPQGAAEELSDDALLAQLNAFDPYDAEFAAKFERVDV